MSACGESDKHGKERLIFGGNQYNEEANSLLYD